MPRHDNPWRTLALTAFVNPATVGPLPSSWEMRITSTRPIYFVDHNTCTTTWDDPRLPSTVDTDAPRYERDYRWKILSFRSQPAMRLIADTKYDVCAPQLGLRGKLCDDHVSPLQAARGQVQGRRCTRLWRRLPRVVLPPHTKCSTRTTACSSNCRTTTTRYRSTRPRA